MLKSSVSRIAVTGATGFIGGRLVEWLSLATPVTVHACVRGFSQLGRLAELPQARVHFYRADVRDVPALRAACDGCDTIVHCAYGSYGTPSEQWAVTVDGTANVLAVAQAVGAQRLVHLSTAAIHDAKRLSVFDEQAPLLAAQPLSYEAAKQAAEQLVAETEVSAIALRPTVVYGPWGKDWTQGVVRKLLAGTQDLPAGVSGGPSNAVHVDDVIQAIWAACGGEGRDPVLIASAETVTWGAFFDAFRAALPTISCPTAGAVLDAWEREFYHLPAQASIARAQQLLDYQPRIAFSEGMRGVGQWLAWYGVEHLRG